MRGQVGGHILGSELPPRLTSVEPLHGGEDRTRHPTLTGGTLDALLDGLEGVRTMGQDGVSHTSRRSPPPGTCRNVSDLLPKLAASEKPPLP